jgi:alpha-glucosidase
VGPGPVEYAEARDVRILLWVDWHAPETPSQREDVLDRFEHWGVAGVKADFLQSDSGARMAVQEDIAADAASPHLLVSFHGATVPRGPTLSVPVAREGGFTIALALAVA